jgi:hypothetical protein
MDGQEDEVLIVQRIRAQVRVFDLSTATMKRAWTTHGWTHCIAVAGNAVFVHTFAFRWQRDHESVESFHRNGHALHAWSVRPRSRCLVAEAKMSSL